MNFKNLMKFLQTTTMTFVHDNISETNFLVHFLKVYQINKVLLYSTGNYIQYLLLNHNGKEKHKLPSPEKKNKSISNKGKLKNTFSLHITK